MESTARTSTGIYMYRRHCLSTPLVFVFSPIKDNANPDSWPTPLDELYVDPQVDSPPKILLAVVGFLFRHGAEHCTQRIGSLQFLGLNLLSLCHSVGSLFRDVTDSLDLNLVDRTPQRTEILTP